jgi:hypothetical protein
MPVLREQLESENDPFSYAPKYEKSGVSQCGDNHPETTPKHPSVLYAYANLIPNITNPQKSSIIHRRGITPNFGPDELELGKAKTKIIP